MTPADIARLRAYFDTARLGEHTDAVSEAGHQLLDLIEELQAKLATYLSPSRDGLTLRLRVLRPLSADPLCGSALAASGVYGGDEVEMNQFGAVSVRTPTGMLGLRPAEFEWLDLPSLVEQARRAGCAPLALLGNAVETPRGGR